MKKTIIFFFLILFFSKNAYSSSCESEFQKPGEGTKTIVRAVKNMLERNPIPPEAQGFIAESAGKLGKEGAGFLKELLKKNPTSRVQKIIAESAGEIGGEAGASAEVKEAAASVLQALLEMDIPLEFKVQVAIADSVSQLGKAGIGVLKAMLKKNPKPFSIDSYLQAIAYSAGKIGAEAREAAEREVEEAREAAKREAEEVREEAASVLKALLEMDIPLEAFMVREYIAESAGALGPAGAGVLKKMLEGNPDLGFMVVSAIAISANRIEEETGIKLEGI